MVQVVGTTHGTLSRRGKSRIRGARPGTQTPTPRSPPLVESIADAVARNRAAVDVCGVVVRLRRSRTGRVRRRRRSA